MKLSYLTSNKPCYSYNKLSSDLIQSPLLKSPEKYSHASQYTKHLSSINLEGDTLIQIQKWWDSILSSFCQSLSTNNSVRSYEYITEDHHELSYFIIPPDTHTKFAKVKEKYEAFSISLWAHLAKYEIITLSKAPKLHATLVTYMNIDNVFDLIMDVVSSISPQVGGLKPKSQDPVISFRLGEGVTLPKFKLRALKSWCENFLLKDKTRNINNLTGTYIMELSNFKHIQCYMTTFQT